MKYRLSLTNKKLKADLSDYLSEISMNKKTASETVAYLCEQRLYLAWSLYAEDKNIETAAQDKIALINYLKPKEQAKLAKVFAKFTFNESYKDLSSGLINLVRGEYSSPLLQKLALNLIDTIEERAKSPNTASFIFRIGVNYRADSKIITQLYDKHFQNSRPHRHNIYAANNLEVTQATIVEGLQISNPSDDIEIIKLSKLFPKTNSVSEYARDAILTLHNTLQERAKSFPFKTIRKNIEQQINSCVTIPSSAVANPHRMISFGRHYN